MFLLRYFILKILVCKKKRKSNFEFLRTQYQKTEKLVLGKTRKDKERARNSTHLHYYYTCVQIHSFFVAGSFVRSFGLLSAVVVVSKYGFYFARRLSFFFFSL